MSNERPDQMVRGYDWRTFKSNPQFQESPGWWCPKHRMVVLREHFQLHIGDKPGSKCDAPEHPPLVVWYGNRHENVVG